MHKKTVRPLRVVDCHRTFRRKRGVCQFIIETIITRQHILINGICHLHIIERLAITDDTVIEQTVAYQFLSLIGQYRTVQQFGLFGHCVIKSPFRIDMIIITDDIGRSENNCDFAFRIIP